MYKYLVFMAPCNARRMEVSPSRPSAGFDRREVVRIRFGVAQNWLRRVDRAMLIEGFSA